MEIRYKNNKKDIYTYSEYVFKNSVFSKKKVYILQFIFLFFYNNNHKFIFFK